MKADFGVSRKADCCSVGLLRGNASEFLPQQMPESAPEYQKDVEIRAGIHNDQQIAALFQTNGNSMVKTSHPIGGNEFQNIKKGSRGLHEKKRNRIRNQHDVGARIAL